MNHPAQTLFEVLAIAVVIAAAGMRTPTATAPNAPVSMTPVPTTAATSPASTATNTNPFGILIGLNLPERAAVVKSLGVAYFRTNQAIVVEKWDGTCADCDQVIQMGLKLILTIRANGGGPQDPSSAPSDIAAYQKTVGDILDKYQPEVLVVENEENSTIFYTSTPQAYAAELNAACTVAHQKGIKCANGGMVSDDVSFLVWDSIFEHSGSMQACEFAKRTFRPNRVTQVCSIKTFDQLPTRDTEALSKDKALLQVYKTSGADYLNFHWYIAEPQALEEAATFLKSAVGLPLISNEMGQQDDNPATVTALLNKSLDLKLAYVIWFSGNSTQKDLNNPDKTLQPTPLINPDNSLRPTGEAFKAFMQAHFN